MKKKLLGIILCLCVVLQLITPIGAADKVGYVFSDDSVVIMDWPKTEKDISTILDNNGYEFTNDVYDYIMEELSCLKMMGIAQTEVLEDIIVEDQEGREIYYIFNCCGMINTVRIIKRDDISTIIEVKQDELVNILEIDKDGKLHLDGHEVSECLELSDTAMPMDVSGDVSYREDCPYGDPSDYTVYKGYQENKNVQLGETIKNITYIAFETILLNCLGVKLIPSIVLTYFFNSLKTESPDADALSSKIYKYIHIDADSTGFFPDARMTVVRYDYNLYDKLEFGGNMTTKTVYYCKQYF